MKLPIANVFLYLIFLSSCSIDEREQEVVEISGLSMGTLYSVKIIDPDNKAIKLELSSGINTILNGIEKAMSTYDPGSELSIFNLSQSTEWQRVSDELLYVIDKAILVSEMTQGAFDITAGTAVNLWGFGPDDTSEKVPDKAAIDNALLVTGIEQLELRHSPASIRKLTPGLYLDLSGIAKGYAVDKVADYLSTNGLSNFLVEIGGEIRASGVNQRNIPWRVAIEQPDSSIRTAQEIIALKDMSMATSGDYRNFFEQDGIRYSHSIDPDTGSPVTHELVSVTVIHPSGTLSDALATGLLVLGPGDGYRIAEENNLAAYFIVQTKGKPEISYTSHFRDYLIQ